MNTYSPIRMLAIVARPEDVIGILHRYAAEGIDLSVVVAAHGSQTVKGLPGAQELVLLNGADEDPQRTVCELVSHLRRVRPQVVLTLEPEPGNSSLGHLATTAVLLAADVRFGHTCSTRTAHTVSKLYYLARRTGSWYSVLSTVQPGVADDDLLAGLREPKPILAYRA